MVEKIKAITPPASISFVAAQPANDDMMVRFTDYPIKIAKYKTSLERLTRLSNALETYSQTKYNERAAYCTTVTCSPEPEKQIYYPPTTYESMAGRTNHLVRR